MTGRTPRPGTTAAGNDPTFSHLTRARRNAGLLRPVTETRNQEVTMDPYREGEEEKVTRWQKWRQDPVLMVLLSPLLAVVGALCLGLFMFVFMWPVFVL